MMNDKYKYNLKEELLNYIKDPQKDARFSAEECIEYIENFIKKHNLLDEVKNYSQFVYRELNILWNQKIIIRFSWGNYLYKRAEYFSPDIAKIDFNKIKTNFNENEVKKALRYLSEADNRINEKAFFRESLSSSIIEGSSVNLDNYNYRKKNQDDIEIKELNNQILVFEWLNKNDLKMNHELLKTIHEKMFFNIINSSRNHSQHAGVYKTSINFFTNGIVPCLPSDVFNELNKFIAFYNEKPSSIKDAFLKVGFIHAWFEFIHPFPDGNGRVGRILINHYLKYHKIISFMNFRISETLEKNREEYIENLANQAINKNYLSFIKWFMDTPLALTIKNINQNIK